MNKDQKMVSIAVVIAVGLIGAAACVVQFSAATDAAAVRQKAATAPQDLGRVLNPAENSQTATQEKSESNKADSQAGLFDPAHLGSAQQVRDIDLLPTMSETPSRVLSVTTSGL